MGKTVVEGRFSGKTKGENPVCTYFEETMKRFNCVRKTEMCV